MNADEADPFGAELLTEGLARVWGISTAHLAITAGARASVLALATQFHSVQVERPGFDGVRVVLRALGVRVEESSWASIAHSDKPAIITSPFRNPDGAAWMGPLRGGVYRDATFQAFRRDGCDSEGWNSPTFGSVGKLLGPDVSLGWIETQDFAAPLNPNFWRAIGANSIVQRGVGAFLRSFGLEALDSSQQMAMRAWEIFFEAASIDPGQSWSPSCLIQRGVPGGSLAVALGAVGVDVGAGPAFGCPPSMARLYFVGVSDREAEEAGKRAKRVRDELSLRVVAHREV